MGRCLPAFVSFSLGIAGAETSQLASLSNRRRCWSLKTPGVLEKTSKIPEISPSL
jgi:hypothetical protein